MYILKDENAFLLYDNVRETQNTNSTNSSISPNNNQANSSNANQNKNSNPQVLFKFTTFYNSVRSSPLFEH